MSRRQSTELPTQFLPLPKLSPNYLSIYLSKYLSISSIYISVYLSIYLGDVHNPGLEQPGGGGAAVPHLSINLSIRLYLSISSIYISVYLSRRRT